MPSDSVTDSAIFVLVLDEALVALDIAYMITDFLPKAVIIQGRSLEQAAAKIPAGRLSGLFVQRDACSLADAPIVARAVADGAELVLVSSDTPKCLPDGWRNLAMPFAHEDVMQIIDGLKRRLNRMRAPRPTAGQDCQSCS